ncbi:MAG: hypothetical protein AAGU19_17225 [Prolixibacteraceae bacterium]
MANLIDGAGTRAGIAGGTLTVLLVHISSGDLARTAILAAVGALVSFTVSVLLKMLVQQLRKKHFFRRR